MDHTGGSGRRLGRPCQYTVSSPWCWVEVIP